MHRRRGNCARDDRVSLILRPRLSVLRPRHRRYVVVAIWPAGSPATVARQASRPFLVEIALNIGFAPIGASGIGCIEIGDVVGDKPAVGPRYRGADDLGARRSA